MTTIESKEIRGITLKVLYLLVAFSITATAGIMTSYFSLKSDNQLLGSQIEILKVQVRQLDHRLDDMELRKIGRISNDQLSVSDNKAKEGI